MRGHGGALFRIHENSERHMTISVPEMISLGAYFVLMMAIGLYAYRNPQAMFPNTCWGDATFTQLSARYLRAPRI